MPKKFHLAQYTMMPVTHHSMVTWKHPRHLRPHWRYDRPELWQHVAQVCERGKFDFFFSADTEGIYSDYQQSYAPAVRYAAPPLAVIMCRTGKSLASVPCRGRKAKRPVALGPQRPECRAWLCILPMEYRTDHIYDQCDPGRIIQCNSN